MKEIIAGILIVLTALWFRILTAIILIVIAISVYHYYMVYLPNKDSEVAQNKIVSANLSQSCLSSAQTRYSTAYQLFCDSNNRVSGGGGTSGVGSTCLMLYPAQETSLNTTLQNDQNVCFKEYPQN